MYPGTVTHSPADVCGCIPVEGSGFRVADFGIWGLGLSGFRVLVVFHCTCTLGRRCPLHMHTWAPVPRAHAHLCANAPCTSMHCAVACMAWTSLLCGMMFRKKVQSMPRHVAASSRTHSATCIRHASSFFSGPCVVLGKVARAQ